MLRLLCLGTILKSTLTFQCPALPTWHQFLIPSKQHFCSSQLNQALDLISATIPVLVRHSAARERPETSQTYRRARENKPACSPCSGVGCSWGQAATLLSTRVERERHNPAARLCSTPFGSDLRQFDLHLGVKSCTDIVTQRYSTSQNSTHRDGTMTNKMRARLSPAVTS